MPGYLWKMAFLAGYAIHALGYLAWTGQLGLPLPASTARLTALLALLALAALVVAQLRARDEVLRQFALQAAAAAGLVTTFASWAATALSLEMALLTSHLWALGFGVFLLVYLGLSWRARL